MTAMLTSLSVVMFLTAAVFSMLGQGGGVLYTPIQVLAGIDFHVAATTSLFLIMVLSVSATLVFRGARRVDWPLAIVLESVTACGGFIGGMASARFSGPALTIIFAAVIGLAAVFMVRKSRVKPSQPSRSSVLAWRRKTGSQVYRVNLLIALPVSAVAGGVSGLVGVGGGILKVPIMVILLGIPTEIAVGSSAFMVGLTAAGGFAGHVVSGHWDWRTSLVLAAAVFLGGQIGARTSIGIDEHRIKKAFGWLLFAVATLTAVKSLV